MVQRGTTTLSHDAPQTYWYFLDKTIQILKYYICYKGSLYLYCLGLVANCPLTNSNIL